MSSTHPPYYLDTLAQLDQTLAQPPQGKGLQPINESVNSDLKKWEKRATDKALTRAVIQALADLSTGLKKSYVNSLFCCNTVMTYKNELLTKYCNNRWCLVCNNIRTAKLIRGYADQLRAFDEPQFVTLTHGRVPYYKLRGTRDIMHDRFNGAKRSLKRTHKLPFNGVRKIEITYCPVKDSFHPHYHILIEGYDSANVLVTEWLKRNPQANIAGQDIRPAKEGFEKELFKYLAKIVTKGTVHAKSLDSIYQTLRKKRIFQTYGNVKRVDENIERTPTESTWFEATNEIYEFERRVDLVGWYDAQGNSLCENILSPKRLKLIETIESNAETD